MALVLALRVLVSYFYFNDPLFISTVIAVAQ